MNFRAVLGILGRIMLVEAVLLLPSMGLALVWGEDWLCFLIPVCVLVAVGGAACLARGRDERIYAREGFVTVALAWIVMSLAGALPFVISGSIPGYVDALFETVSGFTTTGASILTNVEAIPRSQLFWRSFTHWIGGMGVLVFVMAVLPLANSRSMHLLRAEVPGPTKAKILPKMKSSAMLLYGIYIVLTVVEVIFLAAGGMPVFDSVLHAFATAGTGGFGIKSASIAYYDSTYIDVVIAVFMLLFGVNFNLYYLLMLGNVRDALRSEELRCYLCIVAASVAIITANISPLFANVWQALRHAFFQVSSIITTTGFYSHDFQLWPTFSRVLLVLLMILGACAGSTGGAVKVSRVIIIFKAIRRDIRHMLSPRTVSVVKLDGQALDEPVVRSATVFFTAYIGIALLSALLVSLDGFDFETTSTAVIACIGNIGPGLGLVGPTGNFAAFSWPVKLLLSFDMLLGRLELYPMLMLLAPATWRRR